MNSSERYKMALSVAAMVLIISMPALLGCRHAMMASNHEITAITWFNAVSYVMPFEDSMHGALEDGEDLVIYSVVEDNQSNRRDLVVYDPDTDAGVTVTYGCTTPARLIKENYLQTFPGNASYTNVSFEYNASDTNHVSPELHIEMFTDPQGPGALHTVVLLGNTGECDPCIYLDNYDNALEVVNDRRTFVVREADDGDTLVPTVTGISNLSRDDSNLGTPVAVNDNFDITTNKRLGMVYAIAIPKAEDGATNCTQLNNNDECFGDTGNAVFFAVSYVEESGGSYTYHLVQRPDLTIIIDGGSFVFGHLEYGKQYALGVIRKVDDMVSGYNSVPPTKPQKGTQDLNGNLIEDPNVLGGTTGVDASVVIGGAASSVYVMPYFFQVESAP